MADVGIREVVEGWMRRVYRHLRRTWTSFGEGWGLDGGQSITCEKYNCKYDTVPALEESHTLIGQIEDK